VCSSLDPRLPSQPCVRSAVAAAADVKACGASAVTSDDEFCRSVSSAVVRLVTTAASAVVSPVNSCHDDAPPADDTCTSIHTARSHSIPSRVCVSVRCPSVCPSLDRCNSVRRGAPRTGDIDRQRRARSSKREQCHVYSRRRRLDPDSFR